MDLAWKCARWDFPQAGTPPREGLPGERTDVTSHLRRRARQDYVPISGGVRLRFPRLSAEGMDRGPRGWSWELVAELLGADDVRRL